MNFQQEGNSSLPHLLQLSMSFGLSVLSLTDIGISHLSPLQTEAWSSET